LTNDVPLADPKFAKWCFAEVSGAIISFQLRVEQLLVIFFGTAMTTMKRMAAVAWIAPPDCIPFANWHGN
jgi:hypothetical protein